jgi:hypothetical protein
MAGHPTSSIRSAKVRRPANEHDGRGYFDPMRSEFKISKSLESKKFLTGTLVQDKRV